MENRIIVVLLLVFFCIKGYSWNGYGTWFQENEGGHDDKFYGADIDPWAIEICGGKMDENAFGPSKGSCSNGSDPFLEQVSSDRYGYLGNLLQVSRADGSAVSYIWGYDRQYPVAGATNATRSQIGALTGLGPDFNTCTGGLENGREETRRSGLPRSMVTTYGHPPLTGISKMTGPRRNGTFSFYDAHNSSTEIQDGFDHLLSDHPYNYRSN